MGVEIWDVCESGRLAEGTEERAREGFLGVFAVCWVRNVTWVLAMGQRSRVVSAAGLSAFILLAS